MYSEIYHKCTNFWRHQVFLRFDLQQLLPKSDHTHSKASTLSELETCWCTAWCYFKESLRSTLDLTSEHDQSALISMSKSAFLKNDGWIDSVTSQLDRNLKGTTISQLLSGWCSQSSKLNSLLDLVCSLICTKSVIVRFGLQMRNKKLSSLACLSSSLEIQKDLPAEAISNVNVLMFAL